MNLLSQLFRTDAVLATWNRPRSSDELRNFVDSHHERLPDNMDVE
jgi:hypothetical protein